MASNPLLSAMGSYAAWDPLRAAAQRRTSVNPTRVSMTRPGGPQALQRAPYTATQTIPTPQPAPQPVQQQTMPIATPSANTNIFANLPGHMLGSSYAPTPDSSGNLPGFANWWAGVNSRLSGLPAPANASNVATPADYARLYQNMNTAYTR